MLRAAGPQAVGASLSPPPSSMQHPSTSTGVGQQSLGARQHRRAVRHGDEGEGVVRADHRAEGRLDFEEDSTARAPPLGSRGNPIVICSSDEGSDGGSEGRGDGQVAEEEAGREERTDVSTMAVSGREAAAAAAEAVAAPRQGQACPSDGMGVGSCVHPQLPRYMAGGGVQQQHQDTGLLRGSFGGVHASNRVVPGLRR